MSSMAQEPLDFGTSKEMKLQMGHSPGSSPSEVDGLTAVRRSNSDAYADDAVPWASMTATDSGNNRK
jgi:hypothetical protein